MAEQREIRTGDNNTNVELGNLADQLEKDYVQYQKLLVQRNELDGQMGRLLFTSILSVNSTIAAQYRSGVAVAPGLDSNEAWRRITLGAQAETASRVEQGSAAAACEPSAADVSVTPIAHRAKRSKLMSQNLNHRSLGSGGVRNYFIGHIPSCVRVGEVESKIESMGYIIRRRCCESHRTGNTWNYRFALGPTQTGKIVWFGPLAVRSDMSLLIEDGREFKEGFRYLSRGRSEENKATRVNGMGLPEDHDSDNEAELMEIARNVVANSNNVN